MSVHITSQLRRCDYLASLRPVVYTGSVTNLAQMFGHFLSAGLSHAIGWCSRLTTARDIHPTLILLVTTLGSISVGTWTLTIKSNGVQKISCESSKCPFETLNLVYVVLWVQLEFLDHFFSETVNFRRFITRMLLQTFLCVGIKCFCGRIVSKELWPPRSPGPHACVLVIIFALKSISRHSRTPTSNDSMFVRVRTHQQSRVESIPIQLSQTLGSRGVHTDRVESNQVCSSPSGFL